MTINVIGWVATAIFSSSYLIRQPATLRRIQAGAACLWIVYGFAIGAEPVIVANVIVAAAALGSSLSLPGDRLRSLLGGFGNLNRTDNKSDQGAVAHPGVEVESRGVQQWLSAENCITGKRMIETATPAGGVLERKGVKSHGEGEGVHGND